jgi:hypothetical protein
MWILQSKIDPLSLTASIIAVVGAAGSLFKGLKKLKDLREARAEVGFVIFCS